MRHFDTGATRDDDQNKYDYEGFISPFVLERYAAYMHEHRKQADGKLRDSDNWQKGIPIKQYMKSLMRHVVEAWMIWRNGQAKRKEFEDVLCAIMFNVQGILFELLRPAMASSDIRKAHDELARKEYEEGIYDAPPLQVDAQPEADSNYSFFREEPWPTQGDFERSGLNRDELHERRGIDPKGGDVQEGWQPKRTRLG